MDISFRSFGTIVGVVLIISGASLNSSAFGQCQAPAADCDGPPDWYEQCAAASPEEQKTQDDILSRLKTGSPGLVPGAVIRGRFVRYLLTKTLGIPEAGIIIDGATITGPIDIRNQTVRLYVKLIHCKFQDDFILKRSHFLKGLSLEGSSFGRLDAKDKTAVHFDAEDATIDFDFILDESKFPGCPPFFKNVHVAVDLSLRGAKVSGLVDFTGAVIGGSLFADPAVESNAASEFGGADFEGIKVGLDTSLRQARFDGFVNFSNADFNSPSTKDTLFCGDVHFIGTRIHDFTLGKSPADRFRGTNLKIEDLTFGYMSPEDWDELATFAEKSNSGIAKSDQE